MTRAPETPTTQQLHANYPLSTEAELAIGQMRSTVSHAIDNYRTHTLGIIGYCARPSLEQAAEIMRESSLIAEVHDPETGLVLLHRGPMWKPRTNPGDWHGEETTDPAGAYETMRDQAALHANLAVEIGYQDHLRRYGHLLSFMWTGGRNIGDDELMRAVALEDPTIPLGIKNGIDGTIDRALEQVDKANELRGTEGAPVILIYRGGSKVASPEAWEEAVVEVHERTGGRYLIDTAHGSEIAHDPNGEKSVDGQILAMYAMNRLARGGPDREEKKYPSAGSMMEASGLKSPTDPHMPLEIALGGVIEQHNLKLARSNGTPQQLQERVLLH